MNPLAALIKVLRTLIDAALTSGGIAEPVHGSLHGALDEVDPAVAERREREAAGLTPEEQAQLEALEAKQAAAARSQGTPSQGNPHTDGVTSG